MERNAERYVLLRWAQQAFDNFTVVPPGTGIVHQVNLEYLASVVRLEHQNGKAVAYPDTLVGTDSHTTMINGLGADSGATITTTESVLFEWSEIAGTDEFIQISKLIKGR